MNAVEIEQAISALAEQPFDAAEFPFAFLQAFGNKETTLKRLRKGESNKSDLGGVLQTSNIHLAVASPGDVTKTLAALKGSSATAKARAKFVLATDGETLEAEDLATGETIACAYADFPDHFGFFLPLAGITTVKQVRESSFDIRATSRLNRLYVELLKDNPDWGTAARRPDMNHFMARLIFCFFAEDTDIFNGSGLFTATVEQMSERDASNTHWVISELFRAMNTRIEARARSNLRPWADVFPYVNGGLFSGSPEVPRFSRIARSYLLHIGHLDWTKINPDIFGSMIQAVAEDEERGALGMHYTSVPNILKVLNPLFLDDLRTKLEEAGDNARKLLNLRTRLSRIRVFDPACGSGNFLVIAYKQMRAIEAEVNARRGEAERRTDIPLTNFRGIEIRNFPAEIARLALIIAEYQCDVLYRGQKEALAEFLPLDAGNWVTCGNALRLDWLSVCPPTGTGVKHRAEDLFQTPLDQAQIDFDNEGGETYICGNPPYQGSVNQTSEQKDDISRIFRGDGIKFKDLDYVACWLRVASRYMLSTRSSSAFVSTNSICQGEQVAMLWPPIFSSGIEISFCHRSFLWKNNAANNAGVTCIIVGISNSYIVSRTIYDGDIRREVASIGPYLVASAPTVVEKRNSPLADIPEMVGGNQPTDGGNFSLSSTEAATLLKRPGIDRFLKKYSGSHEFINGVQRWCLWIEDDELSEALRYPEIKERVEAVRRLRIAGRSKQSNDASSRPHQFVYAPHRSGLAIQIPKVSSEKRPYLPCGLSNDNNIISDLCRVIYNASVWNMALIASRIHLVWIATVCGKLETRYRYSNTLGWNTFPVPILTDKNKTDLTRCAEDILLAREAHFPSTIADLLQPRDYAGEPARST